MGTFLAVSSFAMKPNNIDYYDQAIFNKEAALIQEELGNYIDAAKFESSFKEQCSYGKFTNEKIKEIEDLCKANHEKMFQLSSIEYADLEMYNKAIKIITVGETNKFSEDEANKIKLYVQSHWHEFESRHQNDFEKLWPNISSHVESEE